MAKLITMKWEENPEKGSVKGTNQLTGENLTFGLDDVSKANRLRLTCFALKTILSTRTSQSNPADKVSDMLAVKALLGTDEWEKPRQAGGPSVVSSFVQAVAQVQGCSIPEAQTALRDLTAEEKDAIKANPEVEKARKAIETKSAKVVDLSKLIRK